MQVSHDQQRQLLMFIPSQVLRTRREMVVGRQGKGKQVTLVSYKGGT